MSPLDHNPAIQTQSSHSNASAPARVTSRAPRRRLAAAIAIALAATGSGLAAAVPALAATATPAKVSNLAQVPTQVALPNAQVGYQYSYQLANDAYGNPRTLRGPLPAGLSVNSTGLITGVPTQPGDFSFSTLGKLASGKYSGVKFQEYTNSVHINWPVFSRSAPTTLYAGEFLQLANKRFVMQTDGNLVMYDERGRALTASNTAIDGALPAGYQVSFQADCNVVIYSDFDRVVWASNTARPDNSCSSGLVQVVDRLRFFDGKNVRTVAWDSTLAGSATPIPEGD